jgi:hypothetical protein
VYLPTIRALSIEPNCGPFTGGTLVTISGMHFTTSHLIRCHFGDIASDVTFLNDKQIRCRMPPHPPGVASFHIDTFHTNVASDLAFEFYMTHQVISAFPTTGPYHGGTLVKINGRHFRSDVDYLCQLDNSTDLTIQQVLPHNMCLRGLY